MRVTGALFALLASAAAQEFPQAFPQLCGKYNATCADAGTSFVSTSVDWSGMVEGVLVLERKVFADAGTCTANGNADIVFQYIGSYQDMGAVAGQDTAANARLVYINYDTIEVTPQTAAQVASMQKACPCNDETQWVLNQPRILSNCDTPSGTMNQCDTSIFGGTQEASSAGFVIGQPAFAIAQNNETGFFWGRMDSDPSQALPNFNADPATGTQFMATAADAQVCGDPKIINNYCASWTTTCATHLEDDAMAVDGTSFTETFNYCGPTPNPAGLDQGDVGWFVRNVTTYSDAECNLGSLTFAETGTFQTGTLDGNQDQALSFQRKAASVTVMPIDQATVDQLSLNCPCAIDPKNDPWAANASRVLTQCPSASCSFQGWYFNTTIGDKAYGTVRRLSDGTHPDTLQQSLPSNTRDEGTTYPVSYLGGKAFEVLDNTCPYVTPTFNMCGMWARQCTAESVVYDTTQVLSLTGQEEENGAAVFYKEFFQIGGGCQSTQSQMTVEAEGFWSSYEVDGINGVLINYHSVEIQTATPDMLNNAQTGCPCGGTWEAGVKRTLVTCADGTCPGKALFGGGILGIPGYGKVIRVNDMLQMSKLQEQVTDGISNGVFQMDDFPLSLDQECVKEKVIDQVCGNYQQPCHPDGEYGTAVTSYTSSFYFETKDKAKTYNLNRTDYQPGSGCDLAPILSVVQVGVLDVMSDTTAVANAKAVSLKPTLLTITPLNSDITAALNSKCPCSTTSNPWSTNLARTIDAACPDNTCNDYSWLRQPILGNGAPVYGSMRRMGNFLRMTQFAGDKQQGFSELLDSFDFPYMMQDDSACEPVPASGSSSGGMGAGSALVIVFLVLVLVYVGGGMALNYQKTQTPTIPHVDFWRAFPGHVVDGINFAVCGLCGTRSTSARYQEFGGNPDNSYGSL